MGAPAFCRGVSTANRIVRILALHVENYIMSLLEVLFGKREPRVPMPYLKHEPIWSITGVPAPVDLPKRGVTPEQAKTELVAIGIINERGELRKAYGGDAE